MNRCYLCFYQLNNLFVLRLKLKLKFFKVLFAVWIILRLLKVFKSILNFMKDLVKIFELFIKVLLIAFKLILKLSLVNHGKKAHNESNHNEGSNQMSPNIYGLIMKHEQTSYNLQRIFIIQPISISDMLIESHKFRNSADLCNLLSCLSRKLNFLF